MADIFQVSDMVTRMVDDFEPEIIKCIGEYSYDAESAICEQLYSGLDGDGQYLNPTYDNDPYFEQKGPWYHHNWAYKQWKHEITPPATGDMLLLPPRPDSVPNLFITGKFHNEIFATMESDTLSIKVAPDGDGPAIVQKYGDQILRLGSTAISYLNENYIIPRIWKHFADCGYNPI